MKRRNALAALLAMTAIGSVALMGTASARVQPVQHRAFDRTAFEQAQNSGQRILIDVYAPWCPTCRAQTPIIDRLAAARDNANLVIFRVDFDNQKSEVRAFRAQRQSTLIAYRGRTETGRLVAETREPQIAELIASTR